MWGPFCLHLEHVPNLRKFMSAARAAARIKPIVALKTGRLADQPEDCGGNASGIFFCRHHVYDAAFRRAGIIRVDTVEDLFDCADLAAKQPRPKGPALTIVTNSRSPGRMAADVMAAQDLKPVRFSTETVTALDRRLSPGWREGGIIRVPDGSADLYRQVLEICAEAPEIHGVLVVFTPGWTVTPTQAAQAVASVGREKIPIVAVWMGGNAVAEGRNILTEAGVPNYEGPERAVRAFLTLYRYGVNLKLIQEVPPKLENRLLLRRRDVREIIDSVRTGPSGLMSAGEAMRVLRAYDIAVYPY